MTFQTSQRIKYRMNLSLIDLADSDNRHTESPGRRDNRISTSYFETTDDLSFKIQNRSMSDPTLSEIDFKNEMG